MSYRTFNSDTNRREKKTKRFWGLLLWPSVNRLARDAGRYRQRPSLQVVGLIGRRWPSGPPLHFSTKTRCGAARFPLPTLPTSRAPQRVEIMVRFGIGSVWAEPQDLKLTTGVLQEIFCRVVLQ